MKFIVRLNAQSLKNQDYCIIYVLSGPHQQRKTWRWPNSLILSYTELSLLYFNAL